MARLHLFDLEGTLLRGTSAPVEISRQLGLELETVALDHLAGLATHTYIVMNLWEAYELGRSGR